MSEQIGTIKELKAIESGTSKGGKDWSKRQVVLAFTNGTGQYARDTVAAFTFFGKVVNELGNFVEGEQVKIAYNLEGREYNGKVYTDLAAYKIELIGEKKSSVANAPVRNEPQPTQNEEVDNLPF
jgi:hypothetical protein